jgi:hypothetical protein
MPKLIKINNGTQVDGVIKANFQESFQIEADSRISLLNMSCMMEERNILIDDTNNTFRRSVKNNGPNPVWKNVVMTNGLYDINTFVNELNRALNASLTNDGQADQGFQFKVALKDNKIRILFNRVQTTNAYYNLAGRVRWRDKITITGNSFKRMTASGDGWNCATVSNKFFTGGAGVFSCVRTATGTAIATNDPVILGLVNSVSQSSYGEDYSINSYSFAIYSDEPTGGGAHVYYYRYTDALGNIYDVETANGVRAEEIMGIMLSDGKLSFFAIDNTGGLNYPLASSLNAGNTLFQMDWTYEKNFYGMLSLYTHDKQVNNVSFFNDPFYQITNTYSHYLTSEPDHNMGNFNEIDEALSENPGFGGANSSVVTMDFTSPKNVLTLLGFGANPPATPNLINGYFQATKSYENIVLPQNMKILLDNLSIDSVDNIVQQSQSILMTIPSLVPDDGKFIYSSPFLLELDLKNKYPTTISELRLRLVDFESNLIQIKPDLTDITLIIS